MDGCSRRSSCGQATRSCSRRGSGRIGNCPATDCAASFSLPELKYLTFTGLNVVVDQDKSSAFECFGIGRLVTGEYKRRAIDGSLVFANLAGWNRWSEPSEIEAELFVQFVIRQTQLIQVQSTDRRIADDLRHAIRFKSNGVHFRRCR